MTNAVASTCAYCDEPVVLFYEGWVDEAEQTTCPVSPSGSHESTHNAVST